MKPCAWRITIGVAVLVVAIVAVIVAVIVVIHWTTVRDHVEAWRFQLAREDGDDHAEA